MESIVWPSTIFCIDSVIFIGGNDIFLELSGETTLSFQFDQEKKIMAFDWREVLTKVFFKDSILPTRLRDLNNMTRHS